MNHLAPFPLPTSEAPQPDPACLLDGRAPLQPEALAELAFQRAVLGAHWLVANRRRNGSFCYIYEPEWDRPRKSSYNQVRHAGACYALWQLYEATCLAGTPDEAIRDAAEAAAGWIESHSLNLRRRGRAYVRNGKLKLGGQALAIVALLERRRVTGDRSRDRLISQLARFMLAMELPRERGRYHQSWMADTDRMLLTPPSDYYPGEALLALTRLAAQDFRDGSWLAAAKRAAHYLLYVKDGDIPAAGKVPREDHWLTMALAELYRLHPDPAYRTVAFMQADRMLATQYGPEAYPAKIGAARREPLNYTSSATKGEAMIAAWALAAHEGDAEAVERLAEAARRNAQFAMRVQWLPDNAGLFPKPEKLCGAWPCNPGQPWVRMDFVQHNIAVLIGLWQMTRLGDVPTADKSAAATRKPARR